MYRRLLLTWFSFLAFSSVFFRLTSRWWWWIHLNLNFFDTFFRVRTWHNSSIKQILVLFVILLPVQHFIVITHLFGEFFLKLFFFQIIWAFTGKGSNITEEICGIQETRVWFWLNLWITPPVSFICMFFFLAIGTPYLVYVSVFDQLWVTTGPYPWLLLHTAMKYFINKLFIFRPKELHKFIFCLV